MHTERMWKVNIDVDVTDINVCEAAFRPNRVDPAHVLVLKKSILKTAFVSTATAPLHCVVFLGNLNVFFSM